MDQYCSLKTKAIKPFSRKRIISLMGRILVYFWLYWNAKEIMQEASMIHLAISIVRLAVIFIHEADHSPAGSDHYFCTCCPSVRKSQNFKIQRQSLPAGTVGWPSGSLMTPVWFPLILDERKLICESSDHYRSWLWIGHVYYLLFFAFVKKMTKTVVFQEFCAPRVFVSHSVECMHVAKLENWDSCWAP